MMYEHLDTAMLFGYAFIAFSIGYTLGKIRRQPGPVMPDLTWVVEYGENGIHMLPTKEAALRFIIDKCGNGDIGYKLYAVQSKGEVRG